MKKRRYIAGIFRKINHSGAEAYSKRPICRRQPFGKSMAAKGQANFFRCPNAFLQIGTGQEECKFVAARLDEPGALYCMLRRFREETADLLQHLITGSG